MTSSFSVDDLPPNDNKRLIQIRTRKKQLLDEIQHLQDELVKTNEQIESVSGTSNSRNNKGKEQELAKKKFNENHRQGLRELVKAGLVNGSAEDIARFLLTGDGIKKSAIGDFLGEKDEFNLEVLHHFVRLLSLQSLPLVQSMRDFLSRFRLPGESQQIERIMECFSGHYYTQNPGIFDHQDSCYTMCYAIIMLNTSLHNPSVKERMSLDNFTQITNSLKLPQALIADIYNSIRSEAFKFPDDNFQEHFSAALFQQSEKQSWLEKQGSRYKTWNRRWFLLANRCLYYFESPTNREPKGIIPLENIRVRVLDQEIDMIRRPHVFELYSPNTELIKACKQNGEGRLLEGQHSTYRISSPSREEMHAWVSAIQRSINKDQYIEEVLEQRRKRIASGGAMVAKSSVRAVEQHQNTVDVNSQRSSLIVLCAGDDEINNNCEDEKGIHHKR